MAKHVARHLARARVLALAILIVALFAFAFPIPVKAQGIALSGNFYLQHFQFIPGQSLTTPDIHVTVFNHSDHDMRVKLTTHAPLGVELILSTMDLTLPLGESQRVEVGISVGPQVAPGEYDLIVTAETLVEGEGIKLTGASQQQAKLTVSGEAGEVNITTVSPQGEPFIATIRLYKQVEEQKLPCGYSQTGELKSKLTPGDYLVEAYFGGSKVAQEAFSLVADETKTITLVPQTVYVEGFSVVRNYYSETGELAFAKIAYTINNTYQPLKDVTAVLKVSIGGKLVEETELISLPTLDVGTTTGSQTYIPSEGWQRGTYNFKIELYAQGELCTQSTEIQMVTEPAAVATPINWLLIIVAIIGGVVVIGLIVALTWRRKVY